MEAIASLDTVDYVALNIWPMAIETIKLLKPDFYVKGKEYQEAEKDVTGGIIVEREAVESVGGKLIFTDDIVFSSSSLINKYAPAFPREVTDYLATFTERYSIDEVIGYLRGTEKLKVLVVGEAIIDEYRYCEAIGKSSKDPTLAMRSLNLERFAGGVLAVANHVANFADEVSLVAMVGDTHGEEEFIDEKLNPKVKKEFFCRTNSPTIVKRRLIEKYFFTKLLEIYSINDAKLSDEDNEALCQKLEEQVPLHDVVIVVDFGHGMMTPDAVKMVGNAKFLAVNAQANAGNLGYNVISKYPRADYVTMTEKEIKLEARDHRGDLRDMVKEVSEKMSCKRVVVTIGNRGCLAYDREEGFVHIPAVASKVVDRVGAGDAFLSVSSLCSAQNAPMEVVGFVGNAVGAWAVNTVCNEKAVEPVSLTKQIKTLLK